MIEVGEYVRTREGYIGILIDINMENLNYLTIDCKRRVRRDFSYPDSYLYLTNEDIVKHSSNIIDLIEEGDYVNGYKVLAIEKYFEVQPYRISIMVYKTKDTEFWKSLEEQDIKSILTKEQFSSVEYRLE